MKIMPEAHAALTEKEALELLAFLITSAEVCLREAPDYGPYRLISAAGRLAKFWEPRTSGETAEFLSRLSQEIPYEGAMRKVDADRFARFLADCSRAVAVEIKRRYGGETTVES